METKAQLRGLPAVIILVIVGGIAYFASGPNGLDGVMNWISFGKTHQALGISEETLWKNGEQPMRNAVYEHYMHAYMTPMMAKVKADPSLAPKIQALANSLNTLKITGIDAELRYRHDDDENDKKLNVTVTYSMTPAPPDGVTQRTYRVDVSNHGRGYWLVMGED